jgi:hypothetical protein
MLPLSPSDCAAAGIRRQAGFPPEQFANANIRSLDGAWRRGGYLIDLTSERCERLRNNCVHHMHICFYHAAIVANPLCHNLRRIFWRVVF